MSRSTNTPSNKKQIKFSTEATKPQLRYITPVQTAPKKVTA